MMIFDEDFFSGKVFWSLTPKRTIHE